MRYLQNLDIETQESLVIPQLMGKSYAPLVDVTFSDSAALSNPGVEFVDLRGETLLIQPETVSWAFLDAHEREMLKRLYGQNFGSLKGSWPENAGGTPGDFVADLYRRGLVAINGQTSTDETIFRDSHNTPEYHLVEMLLTEKCNLACGYCLAGAKPNMPTMTDEIAYKTIDLAYQMDEATTLAFEFAGGEPFLKYDLMTELVTYIRNHPGATNRQVCITAQTNGTLLTDDRVQWLKDNDVTVGVSLDGKPESHNMSRPQVNGQESFSKLMRGIDLLQRHQVPFGVLIVLNRSNVESVQDLVDFLVDNGIYSIKINPIAYLGTGRETWDTLGLRSEEVINYFQEFAQLIVWQGHPLIEDNLRTMMEYLVSKRRSTRCMRTHCGAGETFQAINAKGDIFPCGRATQTPAMIIGNVLTEGTSLSAPGRSNVFIQEIKRRRPKDLEGCSTCYYRQLCQSGCSVQAFERYGTVRHRTPECDFYKTMYPFLMHWLAFNPEAVSFLNRVGYFGNGTELIANDYLRPN